MILMYDDGELFTHYQLRELFCAKNSDMWRLTYRTHEGQQDALDQYVHLSKAGRFRNKHALRLQEATYCCQRGTRVTYEMQVVIREDDIEALVFTC